MAFGHKVRAYQQSKMKCYCCKISVLNKAKHFHHKLVCANCYSLLQQLTVVKTDCPPSTLADILQWQLFSEKQNKRKLEKNQTKGTEDEIQGTAERSQTKTGTES